MRKEDLSGNTREDPTVKSEVDPLLVFDRLEIGPAIVEKQRVVTPYRLFYAGKEHATELAYKFEEDVFDPGDSASENLAGMMGAQVAINYGLFCRNILFHGVFGETDRHFIADMMENTAREIYVKKILQPNPFLTGAVSQITPVKKKKYSNAVLSFEGTRKAQWKPWSGEQRKHAVLSSGGKDSLLSFGLLNDLGRETHPIFVNESGRHWFTALNAYRFFKASIPNTARVWTNSDRLFSWMLRHMPFVRKDFAEVRSDGYPIRLWTVAVFLFGTLPLLRKRGISRILIGDEYDTTVPTSFQGISHYDGLYDQSRFFDNALSRYFLRKGWMISQFSVLRILSEILIQKILAKRYPDLLAQQVSCHAAHEADGRVLPCGKCEKCRRIISMLSAIGEDPTRCGYTASQVRDGLNAFVRHGAHQESAGVEQLLLLLQEKGLVDAGKRTVRPHPEILKIRIDPKRSPVNEIPVDLRVPLIRIFLKYADGAVRKSGRTWDDLDLLDDPSILQPYPFEVPNLGRKSAESGEPKTGNGYLWGELTWPEAEKRLGEVDVAVLPVGAIEQHGRHLPLDVDAFDAEYLAGRVADACSDPKPLVLPLIPYGVSYHHDTFKGTISISNETMARLVYEIGMNAARNGIRKLVIINGHGGNDATLNHAAQMINRDSHIFVCVDTGGSSDVDIEAIAETPSDVHAGEIETSTTLAIRPHLVDMNEVVKLIPRFSNRYLDFSSKRGISWHAYTDRISESGVMGDPTRASVEKGEKIWKIMIAHLVSLVEDLKRLTLDEIHQKRY